MGGGSGGGGKSGRGGGGGGSSTNGDAGQPGEVFRAAEEAKLQARVDNMNQLVGKLNTGIKQKEAGVKSMERELSRFSERDRSTKEIRRSLEKNISSANRKIAIQRKRLLNIHDRMNKLIDENS